MDHLKAFLPQDLMGKVRREVEGSSYVVEDSGDERELPEEEHPWWGVKGFAKGLSEVSKGVSSAKQRILEAQAGYLLDLKLSKR